MSRENGHTPPLTDAPLTDRIRSARVAFEAGDQHPEFETLAGLVEGTLPLAVSDAVALHVESCDICEEDIRDLRATREELLRATATPGSAQPAAAVSVRSRFVPMAAAAALVVAAAGSAWWVLRPADVAPVQQAQAPQAAPAVAPATPAPVRRAVLTDANGAVQVGDDGAVTGLDRLASDESAAVRQALEDRRLPLPPSLAELRPVAGPLMGVQEGGAAFRIVAPAGTVVESDRPQFRWSAQPGAKSYRVSVFDRRLNPIAESGDLTGLSWTPSKALPRGVVLIWQVDADTPDGHVLTPRAGTPEARVSILSDGGRAALLAGRERAGASHLALAVLYAKLGLADAARLELDALASENPGAPIVTELATQLGNRSGR